MLPAITGHYVILQPIELDIKNAYRRYVRTKGLPITQPINTCDEQKKALVSAYENRPKAASLEWIDLINYNGLDSCPFCGGDGARTIEHYLPKACYPEFSVFSLNLMPSCGGCNTKRNNINEYGAPIALLHPYFDKALLSRVSLYVSIKAEHGVPEFGALLYDQSGLTEDEICRVDHHIDSSVDEIAYFNKCQALFSDVRRRARRWPTIVEFRREVVLYEFHLCQESGDYNSWRYAFYHGLTKLKDEDINVLVVDVLGTQVGW
ncbi:hypothetical protein HNO86_01635 [Pseudomonas sp. C1C7]|uniref:hypothetical protein n=1 Tax=Pseudomonas sp. C1C7 TaxID=2735272 RepID=UPI001586811D|nr:hypothetical protein [Pseudomonas sp. C1C7]NUT73737.1 hypothetical protein [Pseudomonas sp. C1C7]